MNRDKVSLNLWLVQLRKYLFSDWVAAKTQQVGKINVSLTISWANKAIIVDNSSLKLIKKNIAKINRVIKRYIIVKKVKMSQKSR